MPSSKDRVPAPLRSLLIMDQDITNKVCDAANKILPDIETNYKMHLKGLEISCHGIPWFIVTFIAIYLFRSTSSREIEINLLLALVYDIMIISFIKAVARRNRPPRNKSGEMFFAKGPDKFSFPSGHASRAVFLALFFSNWAYPEMSFLFRVILYAWAIAVCISRVLLRRHYVLDVSMGAFVGYIEFFLSGLLWVGPEACKAIGDWIATTSEDE